MTYIRTRERPELDWGDEEGQHSYNPLFNREPIQPDTVGFLSKEADPLVFGVAVGIILVAILIAGIVMGNIYQ